MLRFAVYEDGKPAGRWPLVGAHLLGPEDHAAKGAVTFEDGHVVCRPAGAGAVALCLQHDAGRVGRLMLQTCLLPPRERPYLLSLELARHRIKTFIAKAEEWQLHDLGADHPAVERWETARQAFTEALSTREPRAADRAARTALLEALEANERLALVHAEILLHRRFAQRAASSTTLGVRVWPDRDAKALRDLCEREFDLVGVPLRWRRIEVEEGSYRWGPTDQWVDWARSCGKPIIAGPLLDFSRDALPEWMYVWQHDYDTCRDLAYDHVEKVVQRYRGAVGMWNVAAGLHLNDNFRFTGEQMIDLVRMASLAVRQIARRARVMLEIVEPFGETAGTHADAVSPLAFLDRVLQAGIRIDAIGVQLQVGADRPGMRARDLMALSGLLDRLYFLELPVIVSAAAAPSAPGPASAGDWRGPWSPAVQARWATQVFAIAMSKPYVESILWGDLYDHDDADVPSGGLIDAAGKPKPVLSKLAGFRRRLRKPLGPARADGAATT